MGADLMKTTTEMRLVPIGKLVPYVNNARTHSPEQINKLRSSLREFGFINPIIIDRDYGVIAGHGRILAAKEEGISEVPCVFADHLTEAQKKAYCGLLRHRQRYIQPGTKRQIQPDLCGGASTDTGSERPRSHSKRLHGQTAHSDGMRPPSGIS